MKTLINNTMQIAGFIMIVGVPYSVYSGSFLYLVAGVFGFAIMMNGLLREAK